MRRLPPKGWMDMREGRLISGICPQCGNLLQIPAELQQFSCLYCGTRLDLEDLLPEAPANARATELPPAEAQAAYDYAAAHLPECITGYLGCFRHLTKKEFEPYFRRYVAENQEVFRQLDRAAAGRPQERQAVLEAAADGFLTQLEAWTVKNRRVLTSRDTMLDDAKFTLCLVMIPALRSLRLSIGEEFAQLLREKWLERYPKKVFQLTTYQEIAQGFQRKKLCFITTAVCSCLGKPDDCAELTALRAFRDGYLSACPDGPALIRVYYDLAPAVVTAIDVADDPKTVYPAIWTKYLSPCLDALNRGEPGLCKDLYTGMVQDLCSKYLGKSLPRDLVAVDFQPVPM